MGGVKDVTGISRLQTMVISVTNILALALNLKRHMKKEKTMPISTLGSPFRKIPETKEKLEQMKIQGHI